MLPNLLLRQLGSPQSVSKSAQKSIIIISNRNIPHPLTTSISMSVVNQKVCQVTDAFKKTNVYCFPCT